jgi:transcriptional regulator with XRE-family HTH domain
MNFGAKLRELRESKGLSQKGLAEAAGQAQQSLARWEQGEQVPTFDVLQSLCAALDVPCTIFDGCEYAAVESRGRGRPKKAAPEPEKAKGKRKKGGG